MITVKIFEKKDGSVILFSETFDERDLALKYAISSAKVLGKKRAKFIEVWDEKALILKYKITRR